MSLFEIRYQIGGCPSFGSIMMLIARYAALIAKFRGELPRRQLAFLVPKGNFKVLRDGERIFCESRNYRRFDNLVDLVEQVPVGRLAQLLREIDPLVRISLRQLGLSGALNRFSWRV